MVDVFRRRAVQKEGPIKALIELDVAKKFLQPAGSTPRCTDAAYWQGVEEEEPALELLSAASKWRRAAALPEAAAGAPAWRGER